MSRKTAPTGALVTNKNVPGSVLLVLTPGLLVVLRNGRLKDGRPGWAGGVVLKGSIILDNTWSLWKKE